MDKETKIGLFKSLLLARVFEEKKIEHTKEIAKTDMGPTSSYGQEAIAVGFCYGLNKNDYMLPSVRCAWSAYIAKGLPLKPLAAEMYGKAEGFSAGREISSHITYPDLGIIGGTGILAASITLAAGLALASKYKKTRQVTVCFFGDGASNREDFFTGINLAALKKLPALFVVESNLIGEFTPYEKFMPIKDVAERAAAFGIPGEIVDGNDVMAVYDTAQKAIKRAREGLGPSLIECKTCRMRPMTETQPKRVLPEEVLKKWRDKDPVKRMIEYLLKTRILKEEEINTMKKKYQKEVDEAFQFAEECEYASPEEVFSDVYANGGIVE